MLTRYPDQPRRNRTGELFRSLVEGLARLLLGEQFTLVPRRQVDRLRQLERREQLRMAEREGDDEFLDCELAKAQLTEADLSRSIARTTPIRQWPDEDLEDSFGESAKPQKQQGADL